MDVAARFFGDYSRCRHAALRSYFGERDLPKECQACDVCCARRLGLAGYGRPQTRDAFAEATRLVHLASVLHDHRITFVNLRTIALGRKLPAKSVSDRLFAANAESQPEFGALKCLGQAAVDKLIQQLLQKQVLSQTRCLNKEHGKGKASRAVLRLVAGRAMQRFWRCDVPVTLEVSAQNCGTDDPCNHDGLTQDLEQIMEEC